MAKKSRKPTRPKPDPQELADVILTEEDVGEYKRYDCIRYETCLDVAADAGWLQFHCNDCKVYVPAPQNDKSWEMFYNRLVGGSTYAPTNISWAPNGHCVVSSASSASSRTS